jgi:hypothetical protein
MTWKNCRLLFIGFLESQEDYQQRIMTLLKNIMHNIQAPSAEEFRLALPTKEGVHFLTPA